MRKLLISFLLISVFLCTLPIYSNNSNAVFREADSFSSFTRKESIDKYGHISLLHEYDSDLNAVGYLNKDGTKTVYLYGCDIKYIGTNGIEEKNPTIVKKNGKYTEKSNDIKIEFSYQNSPSVSIEVNDCSIMFIPQDIEKYELELSENDNYLEYKNIFGENTGLRFFPGINGYKEEIVFYNSLDRLTFSFKCVVTNLEICSIGNGLSFINPKGESLFTIPAPVLFDSSIIPNYYTSEVNSNVDKIDDNTYLITIEVDKTINLDNVLYPLILDPGVVCTSNADAAVYSNYPDDNFSQDTINMVGKTSSLGEGELYCRFNLTPLNNISYDRILSAYYHFREGSGNDYYSAIDTYLVTETWNSSSINWNNKPACAGQRITSTLMQYDNAELSANGWYDVYITTAIQAWQQGMPNNGIAIKYRNPVTGKYRALYSSEYVNYSPYISITYTDENSQGFSPGVQVGDIYYIKNKKTGQYLSYYSNGLTNIVCQVDASQNTPKEWRIDYSSNSNSSFYISPNDNPFYVLTLESFNTGDGTNIILNPKDGVTNLCQIWTFQRNWNGAYRILSRQSPLKGISVFNNSVSLWTYTCDYDLNQDWTLEPAINGMVDFYSASFTQNGIDNAISNAESMSFDVYSFVDVPASTAFNYIPDDNIVYFFQHGSPSNIQFATNNNSLSYINAAVSNSSNTYSVQTYSENELASLFVFVVTGCNAGRTDGNTNLIGYAYRRGCHFALGFSTILYVDEGRLYRNAFFEALANGGTIYQAIDEAENAALSWENSTVPYGCFNNIHYLGDLDIAFVR